jgi:hypothetical protein
MELLKQESVYEKAITRDLHRTFPYHPYFQSDQGQEALFNVVKAYSLYDEQLGYCQGLAFVAGPLLLNVRLLFFLKKNSYTKYMFCTWFLIEYDLF